MSNRKSFLMYIDTCKVLFEELTKDQIADLMIGVVAYADGADVKLNGELKIPLKLLKKQMDRDQDKWIKKCEKNSENARKGWEQRHANACERLQTHAMDADTDTETVTDTEKDTYILSGKPDEPPEEKIPFKEIIDYLNEQCKTNYRHTAETNRKHIRARWNDKYTVEDFKTVIDNKIEQWYEDDNMCRFLRPETLFGTKFEGYLNE